jgi:DNA-binding CsgD family transcriptional regulator
MSQPKLTIIESLDDLRSLIRRHHDTPCEPRLKLLLALKEEPTRTVASLAAVVRISAPTAKRWLALYRKSGLRALLAMRGGSSRREGDIQIRELQQMLNSNELQTVEEVYQWLERARSVAEDDEKSKVETNPDVQSPEVDMPSTILRLINDLPTELDHVEWIWHFQRILSKMILGVDRFIIAINTECDLLDSHNYHPDVEAVQIVPTDSSSARKRQTKVVQPGVEPPYHRVLNSMRNDGFPFQEYHPPQAIDYFVDGKAYLGTIILLREVHSPSIPKQSIDLMRRLERFIVFMLSDCVVRQKYTRPVSTAFNKAFGQLADAYQLTIAERGVFLLQLLGQSYDEIADSLNVSVNTVSFHVQSIHNKTGAPSIAKLFARYFTPLISGD